MGKSLTEMTLEELWELFPIILSEHQADWNDRYREEENRIKAFLPIDNARISHIGSTAVRGIWAKPIIDILLEIPKTVSMESVKNILTIMNISACQNRIAENLSTKVIQRKDLQKRYFICICDILRIMTNYTSGII